MAVPIEEVVPGAVFSFKGENVKVVNVAPTNQVSYRGNHGTSVFWEYHDGVARDRAIGGRAKMSRFAFCAKPYKAPSDYKLTAVDLPKRIAVDILLSLPAVTREVALKIEGIIRQHLQKELVNAKSLLPTD